MDDAAAGAWGQSHSDRGSARAARGHGDMGRSTEADCIRRARARLAGLRWLAIPVALVLSTHAAAAQPQQAQQAVEPPEYRGLVEEAVDEFARRNFEEARALFARAHALYPNARTRRGLGLCEFELRNYVEAVRQLEAALASQVKPLDPELRVPTEAVLQRARGFVASVVVEARPEAARVLVDGVPVQGRPGAPFYVAVGEHQLTVEAPDHARAQRKLSIRGPEPVRLEIVLQPSTPPALATPVASGTPAMAVALPTDTPEAPRADDGEWYESPWLWVAVGVVVIGGVATGIALGSGGSDTMAPPYSGSTGVVIDGPSGLR